MGGWRDVLQSGFQGLAGAAGNQQLYDQIQQQRDQKKQQADAMRQASLTKVGLAQKKVNDMLVSGVHPETGAPISDVERGNLTQTQQTLNAYAHQIATGQPPPKQSAPPAPPPASAAPPTSPSSAPSSPSQGPTSPSQGQTSPSQGPTSPTKPVASVQDPRAAVAQYTADVPANPYAQKYNQVMQAFQGHIAPEEAMQFALGNAPKSLQDKVVAQLEAKGVTPEKIWDRLHPQKEEKAPKGLKPLEGGIGVKNEDTGDSYYPSQMNDPKVPQEARDMLKAQKAEQDQKRQEKIQDENLGFQKQAITLGAAFDRLGMTQVFQENMRQFGSDLSEWRGIDKVARDSEGQIQGLKDQYKQPGNHAVADNELQNFYTSVVQKGGRKTAAELALTTKIGSFGMNLETMAKKASTGELPDPLRKQLMSGMEAVAKEQRSEADATKPELPQIPTRGSQKQTQAQPAGKQGGKSLADRLADSLNGK